MEDLYTPLLTLSERRHSCRRFSAEAVSKEEIDRILSVAARSPFASGRSQWKVAVVRDASVIAALAAEVRRFAADIIQTLDAETAPFFRRYSESFTLFESAPVLLIPYCRETATIRSMMRDSATQQLIGWEHDNLTKSLSCVAMMLLLAAESLGLGACYMTGPLLAGKALNPILGLKEFFLLGAIIPVGHKPL